MRSNQFIYTYNYHIELYMKFRILNVHQKYLIFVALWLRFFCLAINQAYEHYYLQTIIDYQVRREKFSQSRPLNCVCVRIIERERGITRMNSACQAAFQTVVVRPFQRRLLSMQNMKFGLLGLCILRKICLFFAKLLSLLSHKSSKTKFVLYKFCASSQKFYYNKNLRVLILLNQKAKKF